MNIFKYLLWWVIILIMIIGTLLYSLNHGEMRMDRIFSQSEDGLFLFIGEMSRQKILWPVYLHSYEFNIVLDGVTKSENITFYSLGDTISIKNQLILFSEKHNYETTASEFSLEYMFQTGSNLSIKSNWLNASFVTKTDPNYFRYISNGNWTIIFNKIKKASHIFTDTLISGDSSYAYLKKWTKVQGYMGGYWGTGWTLDYFDISKILKRWEWETYEDHSYLLSIDSNGKSKKEFGLDINQKDNIFSVIHNNSQLLSVDMKNIIKIGQGYSSDTYYTFIGEKWNGEVVRGFLNFVK